MYAPNDIFVKFGDNYIKVQPDKSGNPEKFIIIDTPVSKRYAGFLMMVRDLDLVIKAIEELKNNEVSLIQQSLLFFAITSYAKCFIKNEGNRPSLQANKIFKNAPIELKEEHDRILTMRNAYVAHAGNELDKCFVTGSLNSIQGFPYFTGIYAQLQHAINMTPKLNDFLSLSAYVKNICCEKADDAYLKLQEDLLNVNIGGLKNIFDPENLPLYNYAEKTDQAGKKYFGFEIITKPLSEKIKNAVSELNEAKAEKITTRDFDD